MNKLLLGTLAGLAATVPMTLAMKLMHSQLPRDEQYPLPPRQVAMNIAGEVGVREQLGAPERTGVTIASHFAYGAATGAIYGPLARSIPLPPALAGATFGLAVWAGSYLGWLPAAGILTPATKHPARRTGLMITAHIVWGVAAGVLVSQLDRPSTASRRRRKRQ